VSKKLDDPCWQRWAAEPFEWFWAGRKDGSTKGEDLEWVLADLIMTFDGDVKPLARLLKSGKPIPAFFAQRLGQMLDLDGSDPSPDRLTLQRPRGGAIRTELQKLVAGRIVIVRAINADESVEDAVAHTCELLGRSREYVWTALRHYRRRHWDLQFDGEGQWLDLPEERWRDLEFGSTKETQPQLSKLQRRINDCWRHYLSLVFNHLVRLGLRV
jgi:hypothetical protein